MIWRRSPRKRSAQLSRNQQQTGQPQLGVLAGCHRGLPQDGCSTNGEGSAAIETCEQVSEAREASEVIEVREAREAELIRVLTVSLGLGSGLVIGGLGL